MENDHTPVGPRCGNNPNFKLSPGDKAAVDKFMAYLRERAATKQLGHVPVTETTAAYGTSEPLTPDTAPADQLHDEVAGALYAHDHPTHVVPLNETGMELAYRESAAAVLAVLPAPALAVARQLLGTTEGEDEPDEREPVQLRWGLDDVMYGDDDTTTVLLSGPGREPYWVELDPERTAALRDALAGPAGLPATLTEAEQAMLTYALDQAQEHIWSRDGFTAEDQAAVTSLRRLAAEEQPPITADPLADCATEYHVPVPEHGGTELLVRRQALAHGAGWAVSTMARGGGRAWTTEGWQDSISALSVDRLFCWPDPATAVDAARRALAAPAAPEETR